MLSVSSFNPHNSPMRSGLTVILISQGAEAQGGGARSPRMIEHAACGGSAGASEGGDSQHSGMVVRSPLHSCLGKGLPGGVGSS